MLPTLFTFPAITADKQGKEDFQRLVARLHTLLPWLEKATDPEQVPITMLSANRYDPKGNPAIHCASKEKDSEHMRLCVNTLPTYTTALLSVPAGGKAAWREFYGGKGR